MLEKYMITHHLSSLGRHDLTRGGSRRSSLAKIRKNFEIAKADDLSYLKSLKSLISLAFLLFLISAITGFFSANLQTELHEKTIAGMEELAKIISDFSDYKLLFLIFLNNGSKIIGAALLGTFFGFVPIIFLSINGFLLGLVAQTIEESNGWLTFWAGISPHGIFEIPLLIIGGAVGLKLGNVFWDSLKKKDFQLLKTEFIRAFGFSLRFLLPIIFFTAFVEVFITQNLFELF